MLVCATACALLACSCVPYGDAWFMWSGSVTDPAGKLQWHGVYRRPKDSAGKLAQKLPDDVKKLLSEYPPKKR
jgi:hypothetical protein